MVILLVWLVCSSEFGCLMGCGVLSLVRLWCWLRPVAIWWVVGGFDFVVCVACLWLVVCRYDLFISVWWLSVLIRLFGWAGLLISLIVFVRLSIVLRCWLAVVVGFVDLAAGCGLLVALRVNSVVIGFSFILTLGLGFVVCC